jgi:hypothetical protein
VDEAQIAKIAFTSGSTTASAHPSGFSAGQMIDQRLSVDTGLTFGPAISIASASTRP